MAKQQTTTVVPPRKGLLHAVDATRYSIAGMRRLMAETAARHEVAAGLIGAAVLLWRGASVGQWLIYAALILAVLAVEALNTAIEVLTDRISPEWSVAAKDAKDLGSLAVGLSVLVAVGYVAAIGLGVLGAG